MNYSFKGNLFLFLFIYISLFCFHIFGKVGFSLDIYIEIYLILDIILLYTNWFSETNGKICNSYGYGSYELFF